jgi:polysaccharide export outer membrane protein
MAARAQEGMPQLPEVPGLPRLIEEMPEFEATPPLPVEAPPPLPFRGSENSLPSKQEYTLGPGDSIQIDIFNVPEYSGENGKHQIQIDGSINLPLIGNVSVRGLNVEQAKALIEAQYGKYLQIPLVNLNVIAPRPLQIALAGEVQRPGSYTMSATIEGGGAGQAASQLPTITQALKTAGGITGAADIRQVKVRRPQPQGPEKIISINLWDLIQNGDLRQNISLRDGDSIFIPSITNPDITESTQLAAANFSDNNSQPINIAVVGEVERPGPYVLMPEDNSGARNNEGSPGADLMALNTLTKAIKLAGGITPMADIRQIQVRRPTRTGIEQVIQVDLWDLLQRGDLTQDLLLQSGDTIIVPTAMDIDPDELADIRASSFSPEALDINVVGEVVKPGSIPLPPKSSLNQAILAAGGFKQTRARKETVELIRLNPNGTVSQRTIEVDLSAEVNEDNNPHLLDNDVVIVGRSRRAVLSDEVNTLVSPFLGPFLGILRLINILD